MIADQGWTIRFRPLPALYANGHDPALLFAALAELGPVTPRLDLSALPDWADFDPAGAWLAWDLRLETAADEAAIRSVFEFVEGLCTLDLQAEVPPEGPGSDPVIPAAGLPEEPRDTGVPTLAAEVAEAVSPPAAPVAEAGASVRARREARPPRKRAAPAVRSPRCASIWNGWTG